MTDHNSVYRPSLPTVSPTSSLTAYLQLQYPDYFQDVFGIPGSDSAVSEHIPPIYDPTGQFEGSDSCLKMTDLNLDPGICSSILELGEGDNRNSSSIGCGRQVPGRSKVAPPQKTQKVNVCKKAQTNVASGPARTKQSLFTCVTESAVAELQRKMELWLGKLKTDIQADVNRIVIQALETQRQCHHTQTIEMLAERQHLEWKMNELKEKAQTCRNCVEEKDVVIDNMLEMLACQKNRQVLALAFCLTKKGHMEAKAEKYAECLATLHYEHHVTQKVLRAWFCLVKHRWKTTLEATYRDQAEKTCRQLSCDSQKKITALNDEICDLKEQLERMRQERQTYVTQVKKAFLRGVCALNTETMSAFTLDDVQDSTSSTETKNTSNSSTEAVEISEGDDFFLQQTLPFDLIMPSLDDVCQPARGANHPAGE